MNTKPTVRKVLREEVCVCVLRRYRICSRNWNIRQVWESFGIDTPVINVSFDPTHTELHATLQKFKEEFEFLERFMRLVNDIASSEDARVQEAGSCWF